MVKCLLFILLPFSSFYCFADSVFRDLLNDKEVHYITKKTQTPAVAGQESFEISYMVIKGTETPQLTLLNSTLKSVAEGLWSDIGTRKKFDLNFFESLQFQLVNYAAELEEDEKEDPELKRNSKRYHEFKPRVYGVSSEILSLCNNILVVSFNIEYQAVLGSYAELENEYYSVVHCYDLKTGREMDKRQVIQASQKWAFESLIRQKIPKGLTNLVSPREMEDAEFFFSGAGFYCLLQGHTYGHVYDHYGLPAVHIRLSLEEVQPFLDPAGPYGIYLSYKTGTSAEKVLAELLDEGEMMYAAQMKQMKYDLLEQASRAKVQKVSCYFISDTLIMRSGKVREYYFDTQGNLMTALCLRPQLNEKSTVTDSVAYSYHTSGYIKSTFYYNDVNTEDLNLKKIWNFDERGNLMEEIDFSEDDKDIAHYVYVGDRIIVDFHEENEQNTVFSPGSKVNEYFHDKLITTKMDDSQIWHWEVEKNSVSTNLFKEGKLVSSMIEEGGKPVSIVNYGDKMMTTGLKYNRQGDPLRYECAIEGFKPLIIEFEYNARKLPGLIVVQGEKRKYQITYE